MDKPTPRISGHQWIAVALLLGLGTCLGCGSGSQDSDDKGSGDKGAATEAFGQGTQHTEKGDFKAAIASFDDAINLYVGEGEAKKTDQTLLKYRCALADAYHKNSDLEKAHAAYTEAFPHSAEAYLGRAMVWWDMDKAARLKCDFDAEHDIGVVVMSLEEEHPAANYYYGVALEEKEKFEEAAPYFAKAEELGFQPEDSDPHARVPRPDETP